MNFEFDPPKSAANRAKHGIDLEEAQRLWRDADLAVAPALAGPEPRFLAIGKIDGKVWTAIFTWRDDRLRLFQCAARGQLRSSIMKKISSDAFDRKFDEGEDISEFVDWSKMRRRGREIRRVNVDFPAWVVEALDREASRLGVTRQALVKLWIAERLDRAA
jgi:uncharacterized DUF497 family protein